MKFSIKSLRRRFGLAHGRKVARPGRAEMIAALGLEAEGSRRGDKYNFTTAEFWKKIRTHHSEAARKARAIFGLREP